MIYVLGGGAGLNFKVLGGTVEPAEPKENTIWVNTAAPVTSWDFSAEEPHRRSGNKNLVVYPFNDTTKTTNGITFTDNGDGTITLDGTCIDSTSYFVCSGMSIKEKEFVLEPGTYTLSGGVDKCHVYIRCTVDDWATNLVSRSAAETPTTFTINQTAKGRIFLAIAPGAAFENAVIKPQLEKGSTATSFVKGDATGQVWIATGNGSTMPFNALKKNALMVYPIKVYQYINGAWVAKPAKTYKGGEWCDWALFIYKGGKLSEITGFTMTGGTVTDADGVLTFTSSSTSVIKLVARSTEKIDFTGYETLAVNFVTGSKVYRGVNLTGAGVGFGITAEVPSVTTKEFSTGEQPIVSNAAAWHLFAHTVNNNAQPSGELTLDVSSVDAGYLVFLGRGYGDNWKAILKVDSIKFE